MKICRQALERISPTGVYAVDDPRITPPPKDKVYTEMEALIQHFLIYSQGFTVPAEDTCRSKGRATGLRGPDGVGVAHQVARAVMRPGARSG
jgi:NADH:ubiquinone oxidoreductase subunit D